MQKKQKILQVLIILAALVALNVLAQNVFTRFDLTKDKRFSLTDATRDMLSEMDDLIYVEVLLDGDLPAGFKRLQNETLVMLNEFKAYAGSGVEYNFVNPLEGLGSEEQKEVFQQLGKQGIMPTNLIDNREGYSEKPIYPWALITYNGHTIPIEILQKQLNKGREETLNNSIALLEYNLANAMQKLMRRKKPTITFLEGHGELSEMDVADVAFDLSRHYVMERMDITQTLYIPKETDVLVIAKPTKPFKDVHKFKIDQYIMNGGKVLWLLENLNAELDSMMNPRGSFVAMDYNLGLEDQLFKYGVRVNYDLVKDVVCTQIPLTISRDQQMKLFNWPYFPIVSKHSQAHPVTKNLDAVLFRFAGSLDTIRTKGAAIQKTVLLETSPYTKVIGTPVKVSAGEVKQKPVKAEYSGGSKPLAVALEGEFPSPYKNRLAQSTIQMIDTIEGVSFKTKSESTKMVVIADGDVIKNDIDRATGRPAPLGYYKYAKQNYANKDLILNAIEWLNDEKGIIAARSKSLKLRLLDEQKVKEEQTQWQLANIGLPILLVLIFGGIYSWIRRRRFA